MLARLSRLCTAATFLTALTFAQGPAGPEPPDPQRMIKMRVAMLTSMLDLTDAQQVRATAIFTEAHTAGESLRSTMRTNRDLLAEAIKLNNTAAIDSLANTVGTVEGQLTAIHSKSEAAFYAVLTADQQAKYEPHSVGGRGGWGGPGGPGRTGMGPRGVPPAGNRRPAQ